MSSVITRSARGLTPVELESTRRKTMLWTIVLILFILWLLGLVTSYTLGGFIHILLVLAVIALIIQLVTGRRTLA